MCSTVFLWAGGPEDYSGEVDSPVPLLEMRPALQAQTLSHPEDGKERGEAAELA